MFFKNLYLLKFTGALGFDFYQLSDALETRKFLPCGATEFQSVGFVPVKEDDPHHVLRYDKAWLFKFQKEAKILPSSAIKKIVNDRAKEIEDREARKMSRKKRAALTDEITYELLPNALTTISNIYAYIDFEDGWLVIDSSSSSKAEELATLLRKSLGSLLVELPNVNLNPSFVMTNWLTNDIDKPPIFSIDDECQLENDAEEKGIVKCKHLNLHLPEVLAHINNGMWITKLALTFDDRMSFVLDDHLTIKKLKFLDVVQEKVINEATDKDMLFDAEFHIMSGEIKRLISYLMEAFRGE